MTALVKALGGIPLVILTERKVEYHAAAVLASNYLVVLLSLAARLMGKAGVPAGDALQALIPLVSGTLDNLKAVGVPNVCVLIYSSSRLL